MGVCMCAAVDFQHVARSRFLFCPVLMGTVNFRRVGASGSNRYCFSINVVDSNLNDRTMISC